jgi:hypothetical protein
MNTAIEETFTMLQEIYVAQKEEGVFRRWFESEYFELIVWYSLTDKTISGFQLCYERFGNEHSLTWQRGFGYSHNRIDDGRSSYKHPSTPILAMDGHFPAADILVKFVDECGSIDEAVSRIVTGKIVEFMQQSVPGEDIAGLLPGADIAQIDEIKRILSGEKAARARKKSVPEKEEIARNRGENDGRVTGVTAGPPVTRGSGRLTAFREKIRSLVSSLMRSGRIKTGNAADINFGDDDRDALLKRSGLLAKKLSRSKKK